ncbi:MAG: hypothetical protein ACRDD7_08350 [Peptostreptococcaceae bacterium]
MEDIAKKIEETELEDPFLKGFGGCKEENKNNELVEDAFIKGFDNK